MRGLKVTIDNWNRDVGQGQGVILALGVNQRIVVSSIFIFVETTPSFRSQSMSCLH